VDVKSEDRRVRSEESVVEVRSEEGIIEVWRM
jgi:hypothetical protein